MEYSSYAQLADSIREKAERRDLLVETVATLDYSNIVGSPNKFVAEGGGKYEMLFIRPKDITKYKSAIIKLSGQHGEEVQGPETSDKDFDELYDYAEERGVAIFDIPLANPGGIDQKVRYAPDWAESRKYNDDFVRYRRKGGPIVDSLLPWENVHDWFMTPANELMQDTHALHGLVNRLLRHYGDMIKGFVSWHQDCLKSDYAHLPLTYSYVVDRGIFVPTVQEVAKFGVPFLSDREIDAGIPHAAKSDQYGMVEVVHNGTFEALMKLHNIKGVVVETTKVVKPKLARKINLTWAKGVVDNAKR